MCVTLKKRSEFLAAAASKHKAHAPGLILQVRPHRGDEQLDSGIRVGYTASRKIGNAVTRNRAKRRLRALVQAIFADYAQLGHDYVLIARAETPTRQFDLLKMDLLTALRRTGTCKPDTNH